jgi:hypothetical protein
MEKTTAAKPIDKPELRPLDIVVWLTIIAGYLYCLYWVACLLASVWL